MKRMLVLVSCLVIGACADAGAEIYLWPVHGARRLTSSFGEYRNGHYHAGIDLGTFGRVGLPCLAIGDGCVSRIRISPAGYGKALYLALNDGNTAVYAHLSGFTAELDSLTYYRRLEHGRSWIDIDVPAGRFRYSVGDTVCFTGSSASKAPHLHFEIRDASGRPINPLGELYRVPDATAPIISGLEIVPLARGSLVNGTPAPVTVLFRATGAKSYSYDDTLQIEGAFGFGVSVWDEHGYGTYRMAPLSVVLYVDGTEIYSNSNSSFSYDQASEIVLEYDRRGEGAPERYLHLYRKPGMTRRDRQGVGKICADSGRGDGVALRRGIHRGEIAVRDASGNASSAVFHFALHGYPGVTTARKLPASSEVFVGAYDPDGGETYGRVFESIDDGASWTEVALAPFGRYQKGSVSHSTEAVYRYVVRDTWGAVREHYFASPERKTEAGMVYCECTPEITPLGLNLHIVTDRILADCVTVELLKPYGGDSCAVYQTGARRYIAVAAGSQLAERVTAIRISGTDYRGYPLLAVVLFRIFPIDSGSSFTFAVSDSLQATIHAPSLRGAALCLVREAGPPAAPPDDCRAVTPPFALDFQEDRLVRDLLLECDPGDKSALFRWDGRQWTCVGVPRMEGGSVRINQAGVYEFFADGMPPDITCVAVEEQRSGSGFFKPFCYYLPVEERGCGIDPYSAEAVLNGKRVVCEWDEFRKRLLIPLPASTPAGEASLSVELSDRVGNRSAVQFSFMLQ